MKRSERVAVVGLGGVFPGCADLDAFWKLIVERRCAAAPIPGIDVHLQPGAPAPDKVYASHACLLGREIEEPGCEGLDPLFHVAARAAREAVGGRTLGRAGAIFGNLVLPTESASAWSRQKLGQGAPSVDARNARPAGLPARTLARLLGLTGPAFTLDAACASSLYAVKLACDELLSGRADAMLAGGVSKPQALYTQMGFSQLRALSARGLPAPFDASGDGLVTGEGAGFLLLKRHEDAVRDGDKIWGLIAGAGLSNDVGGSLLAPNTVGQLRAMREAYKQAGWSPSDVGYVECHATGTPTGDPIELASLKALWGERGWTAGQCAIGSVKSNVGHMLTAAGAAGLIKMLLAFDKKVLPPTANFVKPNPSLGLEGSPFRVLTSPEKWEGRMRAAVSGFGFGGINAHILIEESASRPAQRKAKSASKPAEKIAVVGMEARFGSLKSLREFQEAVLNGRPAMSLRLSEVGVVPGRYRVPPKEIEEMLPQQLLMLDVAGAAIRDANLTPGESTGVFIGIAFDMGACNFDRRWQAAPDRRDALGPALTANRTMGALGGIVASRVAREFSIGGPSFTISSERTSGLHALHAAASALRRRELDAAVVGAVELYDPRTDLTGEGAACVVLKRLEDAERDGDRVYAVLSEGDVSTIGLLEAETVVKDIFGEAKTDVPCALGSVKSVIGETGAASGLAAVVKTALCLYQEIVPPSSSMSPRFVSTGEPRYWYRNRAEGPRRAAVEHGGLLFLLEGVDQPDAPARRQPLGARAEALFIVEDDESLLPGLAELKRWAGDDGIEAQARRWLAKRGQRPEAKLGLAIVARSGAELRELCEAAEKSIRQNPERPMAGDRVQFTYRPAFGKDSVAFVFPGSGNHYEGMGRRLAVEWPEILRAQDAENGYLRRQLELNDDFRSLIFSSVSHGTVVSDLVRSFGVEPKYAIGYSLGETAALFALRAWTRRDEMLRRMNESSLFVSDLAGPCDAARQFWNLPTDERVDWVLGVIDRPADTVRKALKGMERAALLIVNAPVECVVGGYRKAVDSLVEGMGCVFLPLQGVSTVHFPAAKLVEKKYRDLHLQPTTAPAGVKFYSGVLAKSYDVTRESTADSVTAQAIKGFDYSAVIRQAYEDGARIFIELGPQGSCARMIGKILGPLPHAARSACLKDADQPGTVLRLLAMLVAERVPVDLKKLYGGVSHVVGHQDPPARPTLFAHMGLPRVQSPSRVESASEAPAAFPIRRETNPSIPAPVAVSVPILPGTPSVFDAALSANAKAHETFLRFSAQMAQLLSGQALQPSVTLGAEAPRALTREQCLEFAVGKIGNALGATFAHVDAYPTRVRLPDEPLMLVDRILEIEGEPLSMGKGRVVTEHDVKPGAWYLDHGRIPTCIAVEAGQADLFLSGYLGIDDKTKGLSVYRLLDAEIVFHEELPKEGKTIRYDIRIERFVQHGDAWLFFFNYDSTVDGRPLLTMRNGCAGFFSQEELAAGKGIVLTEDEAADWKPKGAPRPFHGDLGLPSGRMKLVDRVLDLDPTGGTRGLGRIKAEADIRPDDWHLVCHFKDDNVMPGTLMYECCLHTMRILLAERGMKGAWGPKAGVKSKLRCRGQVLAHTKKVAYEVVLKEVGEDYAIADALMYSDGKPIVLISDMSLQLYEKAEAAKPKKKTVLFDHDRILAYAVGKPSEAFGKPYEIFDEERVIARLPGPPFQFLDRITAIDGCKPFELTSGGRVRAEYDVPREAWYFKSHGQPTMPFAVLLEAALQPCGWLAAYLGSALTSPVDLKFRNLGGTGTLEREVTPDSGTLTTEIHITKVAQSGGMIIQNFTFDVFDRHGRVYRGITEFGFFTKEALSQQVGVRGAKLYAPTDAEKAALIRPSLEDLWPPLPDSKLLLLDGAALTLEGGPKGLGFVKGTRKVNPSEWFFKAHFYQDPVCPGSLGLESFVELLKTYAAVRWPRAAARYESLALGKPHTWLYRGQYTPVNKDVEVEAVITAVDEASKTVTADGFLSVDGLTIYSMKDFRVRIRS